jgi:hypothetical protein
MNTSLVSVFREENTGFSNHDWFTSVLCSDNFVPDSKQLHARKPAPSSKTSSSACRPENQKRKRMNAQVSKEKEKKEILKLPGGMSGNGILI